MFLVVSGLELVLVRARMGRPLADVASGGLARRLLARNIVVVFGLRELRGL